MASPRIGSRVVLDDSLLIEELLFGLDIDRRQGLVLSTTSCWYYRACRAAAAAGVGHLSGAFAPLPRPTRSEAVRSLLHLPDGIALPDPRATVPAMAGLALRHRKLNLLNLEAVAAALVTAATVWLSPHSAAGLLPPVLDAEGVPWETISVA